MDRIKSKPLGEPERFVADDLMVELAGQVYYPHVGEWITLRVVQQLGDIEDYMQIATLGKTVELAVKTGDFRSIQEEFKLIRTYLSRLVTGWNWTNDKGETMPDPVGQPEVFKQLNIEEVMWIVSKVSGKMGTGARKNASAPSPTT